MPPEDRTPTLTPEQQADLLSKLDAVMKEAQRLRRQITRQMRDQRRDQQPTPGFKRKRVAKKR